MAKSGGLLLLLIVSMLPLAACGVPPQDCVGVTISIQGKVQDTQQNPVQGARVLVENGGTTMRFTEVNLTLITDDRGHLGPQSLAIFRCEALRFKVSATGFTDQTQSFYVDKAFPGSIPDNLVITLQK